MKLLIDEKDLVSYKSQDLVDLECYNCKGIFQRTKSEVQSVLNSSKRVRAKYCSVVCSKSSRKIVNLVSCLNCGNTFHKSRSSVKKSPNHYCNKKCFNVAYGRNKSEGLSVKNCLCGCEKQCKTVKSKFYSHECQQDYYYKLNIIDWRENKKFQRNESAYVPQFIRRYLFQKFGNKCCKCGWKEVNPATKKVPLQIDHINGDACDNREQNLQLLCPNCHSLTETFGSLNNGKGRENRRKWRQNKK